MSKVQVLDTKSHHWHNMMVDLADGSFVEDIEAIESAERETHYAKYGKLEPALFEHLEMMKADDEVQVAIWIAGKPKQSEAELYAALATQHPETQAALERSGNPFDVGNYDLINEIEAEYVRMLETDTQEQIRPLARYLEEQGYAVITFGALPSIAVTLPKSAILELIERPEVGVVYLSGKKVQTELGSAVPGDRVPAVWQRGFEGNGVSIGILEEGKIDFTGPVGHNYLQQGAARPCTEGDSEHKTMVASVAASSHSTYTGVAPEATIVDACTDNTETDTVAELEWAITRADPINFSAGVDPDNQMHFLDRAFDHWARLGNDTVTKSSSDTGGAITSPGKGWNVITVGGSDDQETVAWHDDEWWANSGWNDPTSNNGDREKPEVVAPAELITAVALNNGTLTARGTSFSAPQVAGLAALLIDRHVDLGANPTAVKAIIMASAVNNIDGPSGIPGGGWDLKDGAGGIDATLADTIAQTRGDISSVCVGPCWWGMSIVNATFPVGTYMSPYPKFYASKGERIRVAISWWSNADCADVNTCNYDRLDTDVNLNILGPNGNSVSGGYSASWDNNYELVDFVAPQTGEYKIGVYKQRADENSNYLGIAWVKDVTYLPDLRNDGTGISELFVLNQGAEPRIVKVQYFTTNGAAGVSDTCNLNPNQSCWIPVNQLNRIPAGTRGAAIVSGAADVAVVVQDKRGSELTLYNGLKASGGALGWEQVSNTLYAPIVKNNYYGRTSELIVLNTGTATTQVSVAYYRHDTGASQASPAPISLAPNARATLANTCAAGNSYYCTARITNSAGQPLAAVAREAGAGGSAPTTHNLFAAASATNYVPLVKNSYYGQTTGLGLHNPGDAAAAVTLTYYDSQSAATYTFAQTVAPHATWTSHAPAGLPPNFVGSAVVNAAHPLVTALYEAGAGYNKATNAFLGGGPTLTAPLVNTTPGYASGLSVQNVGSSATTFTVAYYAGNGNLQGQRGPYALEAGDTRILTLNNGGVPANFSGAAQIVAANGTPLAATVNYGVPGAGDTHATYSASQP